MLTIEAPTTEAQNVTYLDLADIRTDGGTQQRIKTDINHVKFLEDGLLHNVELDPVSVIFDGSNYWLTDGFHRLLAYRSQERAVIPAIVSEGTHRDAILASVAANAEHRSLPRTRADKRKAVETLLKDPEWSGWSDVEIARATKVSNHLVSSVREHLGIFQDTSERKFSRNGKTHTMNTTNIGKSKPSSVFKDGDYGCSSVSIDQFTARGGHIIPKSALEGMDSQSSELPKSDGFTGSSDRSLHGQEYVLPEKPKPIEVDLKEVFLSFMSNYENFPISWRLAVKKRIAEVDARTAIAV